MRLLGLERADDGVVYDYAALHGFTIVSKDNDFYDRCLRYGPLPKVIWLNVGNCLTRLIEEQLTGYAAEIKTFGADPDLAVLVIGYKPSQ